MSEDIYAPGAPIPGCLTICTATGGYSATVCPYPSAQVLEASAEFINNATALSVSPLSTSSHSVNRHMARSRTPTPANTDSGQGHDHQQDPRSTLEWPPRAVRDQLKKPPIGAHCELEHDEILMKTWSQVRPGGIGNDETDRRTCQSSSFRPIGNCGRSVDSRSVLCPPAYTTATTPQHLIYVRCLSIFNLPKGERALINLKPGENTVQPPHFILPVSRY